MTLPPIILASASPRRRELLAQLGVEFEVVTAPVAELHQEQLTAREISLLNAYRKARVVAKRYPDHLVLGADTLVTLDARLYGKPANYVEAFRMLSELSGHTHQVVTGVCLVHLRTHRDRVFADLSEVTFRQLDDRQIRSYLAAVNPLDKAGAYAVQEQGQQIIANLTGSYSNVVGLPLERLKTELEAW